MIKLVLTASLMAVSLSSGANSAAFSNGSAIGTSALPAAINSPILIKQRLTGKEKLKRLLRPHFGYHPITQDVRDATGDPNIVVFDRRGGDYSSYTCSFLTYRGKRAMICD